MRSKSDMQGTLRSVEIARSMSTTLPPGPGAIQTRRLLPQYGVLTQIRSDAKTFYNAGTVKYTRRFSDGLTILSSYTFSKTIDQAFSFVAETRLAAPFRKQRQICLSGAYPARTVLTFG